jgi:dnd system-associated protein 4
MADTRIRIAKDKAELVKALKDGSDLNGPFQTYADVVAFAAILGAHRGRRVPLNEVCKSDPDPIPQEHFISRRYEKIIQLLAVSATQDPKVLAEKELVEEERVKIFEEYANAGLEILQSNLGGSIDYLEQILLLLNFERNGSMANDSEFDLSRFLSA